MGNTLVEHLTGPPFLLLQLWLSLFLNRLPLPKHFLLRGTLRSPTPPLSLVVSCSLFASECSERVLNKLKYIWDATKSFSQAVMMRLCNAWGCWAETRAATSRNPCLGSAAAFHPEPLRRQRNSYDWWHRESGLHRHEWWPPRVSVASPKPNSTNGTSASDDTGVGVSYPTTC